jgi:hypothetical protein
MCGAPGEYCNSNDNFCYPLAYANIFHAECKSIYHEDWVVSVAVFFLLN